MVADETPALLSRGSARFVRRFAVPAMSAPIWVLLWVAAAAGEVGALLPLFLSDDPELLPAYIVFRLVGGSFAACGLVAWHRRPDNYSGRLMTATGFAFYLTPVLSLIGSPVAVTLSYLVPDLWILFFVPLLLTFLTAGRLRTRVDRILVGACAVQIGLLAPLFLTVTPDDGNLLLIADDEQLSGLIDTVQRALLVAIMVGTVATVVTRFVRANGPRRRALVPGVGGAVCLVLFTGLLVIDLAAGPSRNPILSQVFLWLAACSIVVVPLAFLYGLLRSRLARSGLADLFRRLSAVQPDDLQPALAAALGDPGLVIAYPGPDGSHVDGDGRSVTLPGPDSERSVAVVRAGGVEVAALVYDRTLDDDPELVEAVGAAATITLENRQLQAEARARLVELEASRERIISAADAERRRIERNLHDGAQQRLVTLALQLSLIQRRIREDPDGAEQLVTSASDELAQSLAELRELARGIHPAALDQGLDIALDALALRSAVPTAVSVEPGTVLPEAVAFAAYFVVSEALANVAKYAQASTVSVRVLRPGRDVVVEIGDDGIGGADPARGTGLRGLADRIGALGGTLTVSDRPHGGTLVSATMPLDREVERHR